MSPIIFTVSAPGKVILHGEHAVVYGKTALAASLDLRTTLKFHCDTSGKITLDLPCVNLLLSCDVTEVTNNLLSEPLTLIDGVDKNMFSFETPRLIDFPKLLERVKAFLHKVSEKTPFTPNQESAVLSFYCLLAGMFLSVTVPLISFNISITTDLTIESGMGSSASFGVCLSAALFHFIRRQAAAAVGDSCNISKEGFKEFSIQNTDVHGFNAREEEAVSLWSLLSDRIMHGNPSGIDNSICTFGSIMQFKKGKESADIQLIPDPRLLRVLLVHTGITRDTGKMVRAVATRRERFQPVVDHVLGAMDALTVRAADLLRQLAATTPGKNVDEKMNDLGELIDMNQSLLQALGVSHPTLDRICSIVKSHDLHCKLTGAGGGGYAYVLLPPSVLPATLDTLKRELHLERFTYKEVALGGPGVLVNNL